MKKLFFLPAIFLLCLPPAQAQDRRVIDSLMAELPKAKEDTGKVVMLTTLSGLFVNLNTEEGLNYANQALALAEKLNWERGAATAKERIGRNHWRAGNFDEALNYHQQALEFWQASGDQLRMAAVNAHMSQDYADAGKYPDALERLSLALAGYEKLGDKHGQRFVHAIFAWVYNKMGMQPERLHHQYASRRLSEELGYREGISNSASELANVLERQGNYQEALETYEQSLRVMLELGNFTNAADNYINIGRCYGRLGNRDEELKHYKRSLELGKKLSHRNNAGQAYTAIGDFYGKQGDRLAALSNYRQAVGEFTTSNNKQGLAELYTKIGACHASLKNFAESRRYFDQAGVLSKALKSISISNHYYSELVKLDSATGNWRDAFNHYKLFTATRDSMYNEANTTKVVQTQMQYEFEKKQATAKTEQDKKDALTQQELQRQKLIRNSSIAGFGIMLLFAGIFFTQRNKIKKGNIALQAAKARAEASEAFKSRFLANMSHEIRTPLHGIAGFTDLLLETSLNEKQRRWLSSIHHSTDRLGEVVNDILDLSKLEAGEVKLRQVPFSPARIAVDVQDALSLRAENKGIELQLKVDENIPEAVMGDPTRLYQILMNLAGNAVKFTEKGHVELAVAVGSSSPHDAKPGWTATANCHCHLQFMVTDTGIGIPPEKLAAVFDSFQQAGEDTTARFGGTGLGLTIARELVQLYGSDIQVESEVGKGSVFSFVLHLPLADAAELDKESAAAGSLFFANPLRILLADDNALNREIATEAIRRHFENAEIVEAAHGKEVIELLENAPFDLVLMDMQMPEMTGTEATRYIRQDISTDIPIIALTASATPEEIENALESGMNRHLGKPFKPRELAQVVAEVMGLKGSVPAALAAGVHRIPAAKAAGTDLSFLRDFCDGDEEQMRHFIQKFLAQYPVEIKRLEDALEQKDREAIYQAAHSFRPQLEFVGLKKFAAQAIELEQGARDGRDLDELYVVLTLIQAGLQELPPSEEWLS